MPRKKVNGAAAADHISERQRIEDGIRQLTARLQDIATRDRYKKELADFLGKRSLLTRLDVTRVAMDTLQARTGKRVKPQDYAHLENGKPTPRRNATPQIVKKRFGAALNKWRVENGLSTMDVGKKVGVHFTSVNSWERGATFPSNEDVRAAIVKVTGLPESTFN